MRHTVLESRELRATFRHQYVTESLVQVMAMKNLRKAKARPKPVTIQGSSVELFESIFRAFRSHVLKLLGEEQLDAALDRLLSPSSYRVDPGPPRRVVFEAAALEEFHRAADAELGQKFAKALSESVLEAVSRIYLAGRETTLRRVKRPSTSELPAQGRSAIAALHKQTLFWIGNAYDDTIRLTVNRSIEGVVERGLSPDEGARVLKQELGGTFFKTDAYWYVLANAAMGRAANYGALSRLQEAEAESYEWVSVVDEVTSPVCRYLNGRVFRVSRAAELMGEVLKAEDPGEVRRAHAWLRFDKKRAIDGKDAIWFRNTPDGLPPEDESDDLGTRMYLPASVFDLVGDHFESRSSPKDKAVNLTLEELGRIMPPIHGNCRSDLVISADSVDRYVNRAS